MAHGYLGDGYGKDGNRDPDGGRDEGRREWRGEDRGDWRDRDRDRDRYGRDDGAHRGDRGRFMFEGGDREHGWDRSGERGEDRDRGFFERTKDEARDDEQDYRQGGQDRYSRQQPRNERSAFSSGEHADYLNWRQQQIDALDRDYQDYCRERQQQFHSDFNSWRENRRSSNPTSQSQRQQQQQQQPTGAQSTELELSERDELEGTTNARSEPQGTVSPESAATLGSNNSENTMPGRR